MNILITACNRTRTGLVRSLKNNRDGRPVRIIAINDRECDILRDGVDEAVIAPPFRSEGYPEWLANLCREKHVDIVFPNIHDELEYALNYKELVERTGAKVSIASRKTMEIVNDKTALYERYSEYMPLQQVCRNSNDLIAFAETAGYLDGERSLCCKPSNASGGVGFSIIDEEKWMDMSLWGKAAKRHYISLSQLCCAIGNGKHELIVQEYIEGRDYNTVLLADNGRVISICGFSGNAMEHGTYTSGQMERNEEAFRISEKIVSDTKLDGNACFDFVISNSGKLYLIECNPRLSAGLAFPNAAGADYAYQRCKQLIGEPVATTYDIDYGLKMVLNYDRMYYK